MVDAATPVQFSTVNYVKDNKSYSATKQNDIVTIKDNNGGIRQLPLADFMQNELPNAQNITLEKVPEKDTVEISTKKSEEAKADNSTNPQPVSQETPQQQEEPAVGKKLDVAA